MTPIPTIKEERTQKLREDYPLYQKAVAAYLSGEGEVFRRLRKSPELSASEKGLLAARAGFLEKDWTEALSSLKKLSTPSGSFLNAEKLFLQGSAHFFLGKIEEAALCNLEAHETYQNLRDRKGCFLSLHNLVVDFSRLGHQKLAARYFERASKIAESGAESLLIHRAMACEASRFERYTEACKLIEESMKHAGKLSFPDRQALFAVAADIFVRSDQLEKAQRLLESVDSPRSSEQGRIDFELGIVRALLEKKPLTGAPKSLKQFPEYELKWKLLLAMQSGDQTSIEKLWKDLCETFPALFQGQFQCVDPSEAKTGFWKYLRLLDQRNSPKPQISMKGNLGRLLEILQNSQTPLRKEALIEKIWNVDYDPMFDSRLYKLIERAKRGGISIVNVSYAYSIKSRS